MFEWRMFYALGGIILEGILFPVAYYIRLQEPCMI